MEHGNDLREELKEERKKKRKETETKSQSEEPKENIVDELDIIRTITGVKKVAEAIKKKPEISEKELAEKKLVGEEEEKEAIRLKMVIDILTEDIETETDWEEKANLKKQLVEKVSLYLNLKKARDERENKNKKSSINWEKVLSVTGLAFEEFGPTALKVILRLIKRK